MLGTRVRLESTVLAARRSEGGGLAAVCADLAGFSLVVPPARGGVPTGLASGVDDRARPAQRLALERGDPASHTKTGCAPGFVSRPLGCPARHQAFLAARPSVHGRLPAAADAKGRIPANLPALAAAPPPLRASRADALAAMLAAGKLGFPVSCPFGGPAALGAVAAQPPTCLVRIAAAPGTETPRETLFGSLAGSPVLGFAGFGVPDAFDAGFATLRGADPIRGTSLVGARFADRPAGRRRAVAAARTQSERDAFGGSTAGALTIVAAAQCGIGQGHLDVLLGSGGFASAGRLNVHTAPFSVVGGARRTSRTRHRRRAVLRISYQEPYRQ